MYPIYLLSTIFELVEILNIPGLLFQLSSIDWQNLYPLHPLANINCLVAKLVTRRHTLTILFLIPRGMWTGVITDILKTAFQLKLIETRIK